MEVRDELGRHVVEARHERADRVRVRDQEDGARAFLRQRMRQVGPRVEQRGRDRVLEASERAPLAVGERLGETGGGAGVAPCVWTVVRVCGQWLCSYESSNEAIREGGWSHPRMPRHAHAPFATMCRGTR